MLRVLKKTLAWLVLLLAASSTLVMTPANAKDMTAPAADFPIILAARMPKEARDTLDLIHKGGPFPYAKDGVVFSNRERILPPQPRGFYHEYTVKTPGVRSRGALRIVCGGNSRPVCYFSGDHYQSFKKIKE